MLDGIDFSQLAVGPASVLHTGTVLKGDALFQKSSAASYPTVLEVVTLTFGPVSTSARHWFWFVSILGLTLS